MNISAVGLEVFLVGLGLLALLFDLWASQGAKRVFGYVVAVLLLGVLWDGVRTLGIESDPEVVLNGMLSVDSFGASLKVLFVAVGVVMAVLVAERRSQEGFGEYLSITLFALAGMALSCSAQNFATFFVSLELITVAFYVLVSFDRQRIGSIEAGVKYLILGAMSSALMIYGMALVFGISGTLRYDVLVTAAPSVASSPVFGLGMLLLIGGLAFKIAVFPFHFWAPDVYEGAPSLTTSFLAMGSKAAGVALLARLMYTAMPYSSWDWEGLILVISIVSIVAGSLGAVFQTSLKRLLGYSSIANGGYLLLGIAAGNQAGAAATVFYLFAYVVGLALVFLTINALSESGCDDDLASLAGLGQRCPMAAFGLTLGMVSLAGIPPLSGFIGKFLIIEAALQEASRNPLYWVGFGVLIFGVAVSIYYYFGVLRYLYWPKVVIDDTPVRFGIGAKVMTGLAAVTAVYLGVAPGMLVDTLKMAALALF